MELFSLSLGQSLGLSVSLAVNIDAKKKLNILPLKSIGLVYSSLI